MSASFATVSYIGATILFILSLGGLSNPESSRRGNVYGIIGMAIAVLATIFGPRVTGGGIAWIEDGIPDLRRVDSSASFAGSGWFGMRENHDNIVNALTDFPLFPAPLLFLLGFGGLALAWWREGK